jgi:anti-sigma-K factor RskA
MTDTGNQKREEFEALAAELALGVLTGEERRRAEELVASDARFARLVEEWHERLLPMADAYAPQSPPAALKKAIEIRLFGTAAPQGTASGWWNSLALWRPLAMAASLAAIVLGAIQVYAPPQPVRPPLVAALAAENGPVQYLAYFDEQTAKLTLTRLQPPPGQGRDHELWLVAGGNAPVSLGVVSHDESGAITVRADLAGEIGVGAVLAISDEPLGGSPTGVATGPVIAAGPIRSF